MRLVDYKPSSVQPPRYGTFWTQETASGLQGAGLLLALLLLGFCYMWFFVALIGIIDVFVKRQATYTLVWWAVVFPVVTLTTAWLELSNSMDSPTFRALTSMLTVFLVVTYFLNWAFTTWGIIGGWLVFGKSQVEIEDELIEKAQEKSKAEENEMSVRDRLH